MTIPQSPRRDIDSARARCRLAGSVGARRLSARGQGLSARGQEGGFTLIELMVVVIIVMILAVIAMPGVMSAMDDQRTFNYASSIADLGRSARIRAKARGRAQLIEFASNGTAQRGTVTVFEGGRTIAAVGTAPASYLPEGGCTLTDQWTTRVLAGAALPTTDSRYGVLVDAINLNYAPDAVVETKLVDRSAGAADKNAWVLCFEPNGEVYAAGSAVGLAGAPLAPVLFDMEIRHIRGTAQVGPTRHVLFPQGAIPRVQSGL